MFSEILVPLDGSAAAENALPYAVALARRGGGHIEVMQVVQLVPLDLLSLEEAASAHGEQMQGAERYLAGVADRLRSDGASVDFTVEPGDAARGVLRCAKDIDADLIVMGGRGDRSAASLLGSVSQKVVRYADCAVLLVRGGNGGTGAER